MVETVWYDLWLSGGENSESLEPCPSCKEGFPEQGVLLWRFNITCSNCKFTLYGCKQREQHLLTRDGGKCDFCFKRKINCKDLSDAWNIMAKEKSPEKPKTDKREWKSLFSLQESDKLLLKGKFNV